VPLQIPAKAMPSLFGGRLDCYQINCKYHLLLHLNGQK